MTAVQIWSCALSLALLGATACSKPRPPAQKKKRVTIGITQEPDTLFMPFKEMNASEHVGRPGALMLTAFDEHWQIVPQAAEAIPTVENGGVVMGPDGTMTVTWRLKDGLFWADGVAVTASDFVFGWQVMRDKDLEVIDRASALRVQDMQAKDARTLVVTWQKPYAYYAYFRNHEPLPRHALEPTYQRDKRALGKDSRPLLGGAFTVAEWVPQSHIVLRKNPHAQALKPELDEIVWKIIPQTQTMEAAFLSGAVDIISIIGLTFDQARDFHARHPDAVTHFTPALMLEHIDLNLDHPALKDRRVRQALLYALNREELVRALFDGKQPVAHSSEPDDNDDAGVIRYPYDPAKAKALLDEAGFVAAADGGVRKKGDVALSFTLHSTAGDRLREQVEQLLVDWWRAVGVEVTIQNQPAKLLFGETIRRRGFDSMVMFTWTKEPNKVDETYWRCDQKPTADNAWQGRNYPGFCDARVDALLDEAQRTVDDAARRALHRQIARILSEEVPMLPLYDRVDVSVTPKRFVGWRPTGLLQSVAWNAHEWRITDQAP